MRSREYILCTYVLQIMSRILKSTSAVLRPPMFPFNEVKTGHDAPQFAKVKHNENFQSKLAANPNVKEDIGKKT